MFPRPGSSDAAPLETCGLERRAVCPHTPQLRLNIRPVLPWRVLALSRRSFLVLLLVATLAMNGCTTSVPPHTEAEAIVERAGTTIDILKRRDAEPGPTFRSNLRNARGILIFPDVFKAAVGIGGQGGSGILLVRDSRGRWSYPAFYTLGGGSVGFQLGATSAQLVFILRSEGAVRAVIRDQFALGGDVQWTAGSLGSGYTAATTTSVGADIVGFAVAEGLFAGFALQGGSVGRRNDLNTAYYARKVTPAEIVLENRVFNLHADPLRQALTSE